MPILLCLGQPLMVSLHRVMMRCSSWQTQLSRRNSTDPVAIRDALSAIKDFQGSTYISHYDENRHPVKSLAILTVRDGKIETYKVVEP